MAASLCDWKQKREEGRGRGGRPGDRLIHCSPEEPAVSQRRSLTVIYFAGSRMKGSLQMSCLSQDEAEETFPVFTLSAFRVTNGGCLKSLSLKCDDPSKYVQSSSVASTYTDVFSCAACSGIVTMLLAIHQLIHNLKPSFKKLLPLLDEQEHLQPITGLARMCYCKMKVI